MNQIQREFYLNKDVVRLSERLLGKVLCTRIDDKLTKGIICETEAYAGAVDKASHAYGNKRTKRTETLFKKGGISYVYLSYGIHHLFNIVSNEIDIPHAVLIRGIIPFLGKEAIFNRRNNRNLDLNCCIGPGKMSQALGINVKHNDISLNSDIIWLEDHQFQPKQQSIIISKRIGIDYAEEDADLPYRFECYNFDNLP